MAGSCAQYGSCPVTHFRYKEDLMHSIHKLNDNISMFTRLFGVQYKRKSCKGPEFTCNRKILTRTVIKKTFYWSHHLWTVLSDRKKEKIIFSALSPVCVV